MNGQSDKTLALSEEMSRTLAGVDLSDPAQRTAAALFVVLKSQLDMLGYRPGTVPFDARFGSDRCRGALLGTAIAVVRGHREAPEREHYIDAITAAFTVVFGEAVGRAKPSGAKGTYMKKVSISSTMGPGVSVDLTSATQA